MVWRPPAGAPPPARRLTARAAGHDLDHALALAPAPGGTVGVAWIAASGRGESVVVSTGAPSDRWGAATPVGIRARRVVGPALAPAPDGGAWVAATADDGLPDVRASVLGRRARVLVAHAPPGGGWARAEASPSGVTSPPSLVLDAGGAPVGAWERAARFVPVRPGRAHVPTGIGVHVPVAGRVVEVPRSSRTRPLYDLSTRTPPLAWADDGPLTAGVEVPPGADLSAPAGATEVV